LLASLKDAEVARAIAHNVAWLQDYPRFTPPEILGLVNRTRSDGYATNEGRIVAAMKAIGVAIGAADGQPVVALSVAAIWDRMSSERCTELLRSLREEAQRLQETGDLSEGV
jgi:DNA-binding IclR family transcriptional regulator